MVRRMETTMALATRIATQQELDARVGTMELVQITVATLHGPANAAGTIDEIRKDGRFAIRLHGARGTHLARAGEVRLFVRAD